MREVVQRLMAFSSPFSSFMTLAKSDRRNDSTERLAVAAMAHIYQWLSYGLNALKDDRGKKRCICDLRPAALAKYCSCRITVSHQSHLCKQ